MGERSAFIIKGVIVLALLWAGVWGIMRVAGVYEATPEKIAEYVDERPFSEISDPGERRARIEKIAKMTNLLTFEQRREFRETEERRAEEYRKAKVKHKVQKSFFDELTREEQLLYLDLTIGTGFKQMMVAFNEMPREKRQLYIDRARRDIERSEAEGEGADGRRIKRLEEQDDEIYNKIAEEGLRSYYQDASAATKRDLAPLLEEMQRSMQRP